MGMDLCVFPSFPSLFALADPKEAWMKDVWPGQQVGGVRVFALLGPLTIRRWKRWWAF